MTVQNENNVMVVEARQSVRKRGLLKTKKGIAAAAAGTAVVAGVVTGAIIGGRKLIKKH